MIIENPAAFPFFITEGIYLHQIDIPVKKQVETVELAPIEKALFVETVVETPVAKASVNTFHYIGKNEKHFLIIGHYADSDHLPDKHLDALKSVLQRKELSLNDVAILNLRLHSEASAEQLTSYFKPSRLLLLGQPCILPAWGKMMLNQLGDVQNCKILYTYSFAEMMGDREKTKAFWEQVKQM